MNMIGITLASGTSFGLPVWLWLLIVGVSIGGAYLVGQRRGVRVSEAPENAETTGGFTSELEQVLATQLSMFDRYRRPFCLMIMSVDDPRHLETGSFVDPLIGTIRDSDQVIRLEDDRIAIVVPSTDLFGCCQIGDRLRREAQSLSGTNDDFTVSIGIASGMDSDDVATLIARTDEALAFAVSDGGNRVCRHTGDAVEQIECRPSADVSFSQ